MTPGCPGCDPQCPSGGPWTEFSLCNACADAAERARDEFNREQLDDEEDET